jgi:hypothetical protein
MPKQYAQFMYGENRSLSEQLGFFSLTNCDVHTDLGVLSNNLALETESSTPNEDCISEILSNGDTFFFSTESGKIWKRTAAGVYSLVHTNTQGANRGCKLWQGYLYYASAAKLGRITEALASSQATWSSQVDTWNTFANASVYKPMFTIGSGLYIGDQNDMYAVDSTHTFIVDALDLPSQFTISAIDGATDDLLIGTIIGANVPWCKMFVWNRISPSWTGEDRIPEIGVNCFLKVDNMYVFQAGVSGQLYYWNGNAIKLKKIKGVTTTVNPYNATEYKGRALFAVGLKVYSLHREDEDFKLAVVCEYTHSGTIKSIIATVNDIFVSGGDVIGHIGASYATAVIETPEADTASHIDSNGNEVSFTKVVVPYRSISTVGIDVKIDNGSYVPQTVVVDTIRKEVRTETNFGNVNTIQARVTLTGLSTIKAINIL